MSLYHGPRQHESLKSEAFVHKERDWYGQQEGNFFPPASSAEGLTHGRSKRDTETWEDSGHGSLYNNKSEYSSVTICDSEDFWGGQNPLYDCSDIQYQRWFRSPSKSDNGKLSKIEIPVTDLQAISSDLHVRDGSGAKRSGKSVKVKSWNGIVARRIMKAVPANNKLQSYSRKPSEITPDILVKITERQSEIFSVQNTYDASDYTKKNIEVLETNFPTVEPQLAKPAAETRTLPAAIRGVQPPPVEQRAHKGYQIGSEFEEANVRLTNVRNLEKNEQKADLLDASSKQPHKTNHNSAAIGMKLEVTNDNTERFCSSSRYFI